MSIHTYTYVRTKDFSSQIKLVDVSFSENINIFTDIEQSAVHTSHHHVIYNTEYLLYTQYDPVYVCLYTVCIYTVHDDLTAHNSITFSITVTIILKLGLNKRYNIILQSS